MLYVVNHSFTTKLHFSSVDKYMHRTWLQEEMGWVFLCNVQVGLWWMWNDFCLYHGTQALWRQAPAPMKWPLLPLRSFMCLTWTGLISSPYPLSLETISTTSATGGCVWTWWSSLSYFCSLMHLDVSSSVQQWGGRNGSDWQQREHLTYQKRHQQVARARGGPRQSG